MVSIEFSHKSSADIKLRSIYNNILTLPNGTPTEWDKRLKEFDPELSLRYNPRTRNFLIFYDHHGRLSCIRSFNYNEPFGRHFLDIKHNSTLSAKKLTRMHKAWNDGIESDIDGRINQCAEEFAIELHNCTKRRVVTDSIKDNNY